MKREREKHQSTPSPGGFGVSKQNWALVQSNLMSIPTSRLQRLEMRFREFRPPERMSTSFFYHVGVFWVLVFFTWREAFLI